MKKIDFEWNVWTWDFNHDELVQYDIVPIFMDELNNLSKSKKPKSKEEFEHFLNSEARYHFWSKCEYEMIIHGWPKNKNSIKVDVYKQLKLNWNLFVDCFWEKINNKRHK